LDVPEDMLFGPVPEYLQGAYKAQLLLEVDRWKSQLSSLSPREREEATRNLSRLKELEGKLFQFLCATYRMALHKVCGSAQDGVAEHPGITGARHAYQAFLGLSVPAGLSRACGGGPGFMEATALDFFKIRKAHQFRHGDLIPRNVGVRLGAFDERSFGEKPQALTEYRMEGDLTAPPHRFLSTRTECLLECGQTVLNILYPGGLGTLKEFYDILVGDQLKSCVWSFTHQRPVPHSVLLDGTDGGEWFWDVEIKSLARQEKLGAINLRRQQPLTILRPNGGPVSGGSEFGGLCKHFTVDDATSLEDLVSSSDWKAPIRVVYGSPSLCGELMFHLAQAKYSEMVSYFANSKATPAAN